MALPPREGVGEKPEEQTRITAIADDDAELRETSLFRNCAGYLPSARKACLGLADALFVVSSALSASLIASPSCRPLIDESHGSVGA